MRERYPWPMLRPATAGLAALLILGGPAWGQQTQQRTSTSTSKDQARDNRSESGEGKEQSKGRGEQSREEVAVVRTYGTEGHFRTELSTRVKGSLTGEDSRQLALLLAEVFQHIDKARIAVDADDAKEAREEVNKAREAIRTIRMMLPKEEVRTKTTGPDGKVVFDDSYEVVEGRIPLFEGMLHAQTLAPIVAARRNALEIAGVRVVESETVITEALANIEPLDAQLARAAKALDENQTDTAAKALAMALVRGLELRYRKEDTELASARDAIWLSRRSLEENNTAQALVNLAIARQRLRLYREIASAEQRPEVDQMLREIDQLEGQLRQEGARTQTASRAQRTHQSTMVTHWWDRVNGWFKRHL